MSKTACVEAELAATESPEITGATAVLTGPQIRAARALLGWRVVDLAEKAGLSYAAVQRAESVDDVPRMQVRNLTSIKQLEKAGVEFLDGDYSGRGGPGVRLRAPK
jgi:ribosome-binding protein aMBF1 (putative translation factor)